MTVIGGFRSDLSITRKTDGNFGNVCAGVLKVAYQRKRWLRDYSGFQKQKVSKLFFTPTSSCNVGFHASVVDTLLLSS